MFKIEDVIQKNVNGGFRKRIRVDGASKRLVLNRYQPYSAAIKLSTNLETLNTMLLQSQRNSGDNFILIGLAFCDISVLIAQYYEINK